MFNSNKQGT